MSDQDPPGPDPEGVRARLARLGDQRPARGAAEVTVVLPERAPAGAALHTLRRRIEALTGRAPASGAHAPETATVAAHARPAQAPGAAPSAPLDGSTRVAPLRATQAPAAAPSAPWDGSTRVAPSPAAATPSAPPGPPRPRDVGARLDALLRSAGLSEPIAPRTPGVRGAGVLAGAFEGEHRSTPHGAALVLARRYEADHLHGDRALSAPLHRIARHAAVLTTDRALAAFDPRGALFLDIEATGLAPGGGTLPFLVGAAHFHGDALVLEQWLMGEPDDEPAALHDLAERMAQSDYLVTFNGRSFDVPCLRARYRLNRLPDPTAALAGHLDLLVPSRRMLTNGLPNRRLCTIETHVLGLLRGEDDLPGAEVPGRYHDWLNTGDPGLLRPVIGHNRDDVLSMVTLLDELLRRVEIPEATLLRDPAGGLAIGACALRVGDLDLADRVFGLAAGLPECRLSGERGLAKVARRRARVAREAARVLASRDSRDGVER